VLKTYWKWSQQLPSANLEPIQLNEYTMLSYRLYLFKSVPRSYFAITVPENSLEIQCHDRTWNTVLGIMAHKKWYNYKLFNCYTSLILFPVLIQFKFLIINKILTNWNIKTFQVLLVFSCPQTVLSKTEHMWEALILGALSRSAHPCLRYFTSK